MIKKFARYFHRWIALPVGILILITCLSGAILVFEKEYLTLRYPERYNLEQTQDNILPLPSLYEKLIEQLGYKKEIYGFYTGENPSKSWEIMLKGEGKMSHYINPYTGEYLGSYNPYDKKHIFGIMRHTHRWLMTPYKRGEFSWGKTLTGLGTLVFVSLILTGLILWAPKKLRNLSQKLRIEKNRGTRRLMWDLHIVGGMYFSLLLLLLSLTGLTWSYPAYRALIVDTIAGKEEQTTSKEKERPENTDLGAWDRAFQKIAIKENGKKMAIREGQISIYRTDSGNSRAADNYTFQATSGKILERVSYEDSSDRNKVAGWIYSLHVGTWGGLFSKTISFLACLFGVFLVASGYYLWLKRKKLI